MVHLILFMLASYGLFSVLSGTDLPVWGRLRDSVADRWEGFGRFILCPLCFGFWCSVALAEVSPLVTLDPAYFDPVIARWVIAPFVQGLAGAATIYLLEQHVDRLLRR